MDWMAQVRAHQFGHAQSVRGTAASLHAASVVRAERASVEPFVELTQSVAMTATLTKILSVNLPRYKLRQARGEDA